MFKRLAALGSLVSICSGAMIVQHQLNGVPSGFISNGPAPATETITIRLALTSTDMQGLEQKLFAVSDPRSAEYGQFLTQAEVRPSLRIDSASLTAGIFRLKLSFNRHLLLSQPSTRGQ
jgi:tripeptidyl-peptidase-1